MRFASEGCRIIGCDIASAAAEETHRLVSEAGGDMQCLFPLDLTNEDDCKRLARFAVEQYGGVDVLYNNAARMHAGFPLSSTLAAFEFSVRNTLTLSWLVTKHVAPLLRPGGSVIYIASQGGVHQGGGIPGNVPFVFAYCLGKAAIIRMTSIMAIELAAQEIRVNCISPGPINTPIASELYGTPGAILYDPYLSQTLVNRIGTADDIVSTALFLASDESSYLTGQNIIVDGGIVASLGVGRPDVAMRSAFKQDYGHWLNHDHDSAEAEPPG